MSGKLYIVHCLGLSSHNGYLVHRSRVISIVTGCHSCRGGNPTYMLRPKHWHLLSVSGADHSTKKPVTTMLTYPWKCTVLHCNHLGNTWKPLVLMTRHFDYCPSASEGDNQSVRSSAPVVSRCFPGGYNLKLYISRGRLAWWLLAFLHSGLYLAPSSVKTALK